ncbi:MAG TPA: alpha/beta fold hydrolase [Syntrophomonadaceae bacterium]|nr:alpha/beta fold hydrolase [Syntrophomonadaceae bacterium]
MSDQCIEAGGRRIAALFFIPDDFQYMMIICHGFRGTRVNGGRIYHFASQLNRMGVAVTAFDFCGSGQSSGSFQDMTLSSQAHDLAVVIETIRKRYPVPQILLGRSFGGSTLLAANSCTRDAVALIFWSAPVLLEATFRKVFGEAYDQLVNGSDVSFQDEGGRFQIGAHLVRDFEKHSLTDSQNDVDQIPVLIVQGLQDQIVAPENAFILQQYFSNSSLEMVEGADHRFIDQVEVREKITLNWIKQNILQTRK